MRFAPCLRARDLVQRRGWRTKLAVFVQLNAAQRMQFAGGAETIGQVGHQWPQCGWLQGIGVGEHPCQAAGATLCHGNRHHAESGGLVSEKSGCVVGAVGRSDGFREPAVALFRGVAGCVVEVQR